MRKTLSWLHPKSHFGRCRLTLSRYHLLSLLKFIIWFTVGAMTGFGLSRIYSSHRYGAISRPPCDRSYWLNLLKNRQQQHGNKLRRYLVQILVIHVEEESQQTFKLRRKFWRRIAKSKMAAINHVLHFVDQSLHRGDGGDDRESDDRDWLVPIAGLSNATFEQSLKLIIYQLLKSSLLSHEFYCFVTDDVKLDHRGLRHLLNSISLLKPLSIEKGTSKEQIQQPGCLLASNSSPEEGMIVSRLTLENALDNLTVCMLSGDFEPFLDFKSIFHKCVTMSTLFECVQSLKVDRIFRFGYKCESTEQHFAGPEEVKCPTSKSSHFPMEILATERYEIELLQRRSARLTLESSAFTNMVDFINHNRSLTEHQIHTYQRWLTSQTFPQNLPFPDSLETSPWHYTNDRYIYTTHNLHKSPTQKLSVKNSSWLFDTTRGALFGTWQIFDEHITRLRFRYAYRHVHPVLGVRHLWRIGATLRPKHPKIKPRLCNVTFYTRQKYQWPPLSKIEEATPRGKRQYDIDNKHISLIVPVAGRHGAIVRFLKTLEHVLLTEINMDVIFIVFIIGSDRKTLHVIESLRDKYPNIKIQVIIQQELFARANALQIGVNHTRSGVILLFVDVDMAFTNSFLYRVRVNTILGQQAYFPIYFSQYNSAPKCNSHKNCSHFSFKTTDGLWRYFGFGMVSIYKEDFVNIGGYDLSIKGWGQEDIRFYESSLKNMTVFRAPDPGLVHIYHNKSCSSTLTPLQYEMCLGSKFDIFNHQRTLANITYNNHHILNRSVG